MTHLETEIKQLKNDTIEMWNLVIVQVEKASKAMIDFDKGLAKDINTLEKRVDAFELKLNMDCENILALFNPLAIDLRFVIAVLKINYNLERIGDYANNIAGIVKHSDSEFDMELLDSTKLTKMFEISQTMLRESLEAFENENNQLAREILTQDEQLDKINISANATLKASIETNPGRIEQHLNILSIIRTLERVGDQTKNIAEEIIFFIEAKVLRHSMKKK
jgi:phosphate transport system protein